VTGDTGGSDALREIESGGRLRARHMREDEAQAEEAVLLERLCRGCRSTTGSEATAGPA